ncbi:MAG: methyltransferase domain-containing protein [Armatimonadetes bacterium]|nr:MAG: methyltransferase domain-containing protein [Armatimonadota bacterium]
MNPEHPMPPRAAIMSLLGGQHIARCLSIVADLGIADLLVDGPKDVESLANSAGADPDALYRVLRLLSRVGVFAERPGRVFEQTPNSAVLSESAPDSVKQYARYAGTHLHWNIVTHADYSVRTANPASTKDRPGAKPYDILSEDPAVLAIFNAAMTELSSADGPAIASAYDFTPYKRIVDVGGGQGELAVLVAQSAPDSEVTVFELPHVAEDARRRLHEQYPHLNVKVAEGNALEGVPGKYDLCIMKHVAHGFDEAGTLALLKSCRSALDENGRLLLCEVVVTPGPESTGACVLDIEMLVFTGGRERSQEEFAELLHRAGFRLERIIETGSWVQVVEAAVA